MAAQTVLLMVWAEKGSWIQEVFHKLMGHNAVYGTEKSEEGRTTPGCGFGNWMDDDTIYQNRKHAKAANLEWKILNIFHLDFLN